MTFELDGRYMTDRESLHAHISERLELPGYYGRNLDALYDMLTEMNKGSVVVIKNTACLEENLGTYARAVMKTFEDAARKNPGLEVRTEK